MSEPSTTPATAGAVTSITIQGGSSVTLITKPAWWHLALAYGLGAIVGGLAMMVMK